MKQSPRVVYREYPVDFNGRQSTKLEEKNPECIGNTYVEGEVSYRPTAKEPRPLSPNKFEYVWGKQYVEETFSSSMKGPSLSAISTTCDAINRMTKCSVPVGDKFPSSFSHGRFRLIQQDGSPFYSFCEQGSDEMLFARAFKPGSACCADSCSPDFHYAFHSRRDDKLKRRWCCWQSKRDQLISIPIAEMKVSSSSKHVDNNNRCIEATHFVLYTERNQRIETGEEGDEDDSMMRMLKARVRGKESMESPNNKGKSYIEFMAVAITVSTTLKDTLTEQLNHEFSSDNECISRNSACVDQVPLKCSSIKAVGKSPKHSCESKAPVEKGKKPETSQFGNSSEAIPETSQFGNSSEASRRTCLKELQGGRDRTGPHSAYAPLLLNEGLKCSRSIGNGHDPQKAEVDVVVLLPAGCHSVTRGDDGNSLLPISLLEYWQSDGHCDCGGWDMGCGILVLRSETLGLHSRSAIALTNYDRINWILPERPLVIFSQGTKRRKLFMIETIEPGLYALIFQEPFSPLQAFATTVAIFHQQMTLK